MWEKLSQAALITFLLHLVVGMQLPSIRQQFTIAPSQESPHSIFAFRRLEHSILGGVQFR